MTQQRSSSEATTKQQQSSSKAAAKQQQRAAAAAAAAAATLTELSSFFGFFTGIGQIIGLILPWLFDLGWPLAPWAIAIVFFVWGLVAPNTLRSFYRLWMRFGFVMNFLVTRIVLGVVFFIGLLPYGLVFRLRGQKKVLGEKSLNLIEPLKRTKRAVR